MIRIRMKDFERIVREAFEELPESIRARISNLEIEVKDRPSAEDLDEAAVDDPADLFGLYRGVPLTARSTHYDMTLPDLITIYRYAHVHACDSLEALREEVRRTLRHELAHHFGIDDDRLEALDAY
ncbi:MAG: metallopeptidase family protein [Thermoflexales bacterium]|nr:metallopeptidase family protein [Thermoflexales bacterium]MCS7325518.1 metallopeptidase family protein [Thermoflexales bacterium]MCX7938066.1 metallopeptidase family protein [Thermoflexales bacterium]MDW8053904.1 metallopeptidase family protein [Anaerolineae bacterium]MDW8292446.1 metallopeptidase family protein [Anaerolineae bacterium]